MSSFLRYRFGAALALGLAMAAGGAVTPATALQDCVAGATPCVSTPSIPLPTTPTVSPTVSPLPTPAPPAAPPPPASAPAPAVSDPAAGSSPPPASSPPTTSTPPSGTTSGTTPVAPAAPSGGGAPASSSGGAGSPSGAPAPAAGWKAPAQTKPTPKGQGLSTTQLDGSTPAPGVAASTLPAADPLTTPPAPDPASVVPTIIRPTATLLADQMVSQAGPLISPNDSGLLAIIVGLAAASVGCAIVAWRIRHRRVPRHSAW